MTREEFIQVLEYNYPYEIEGNNIVVTGSRDLLLKLSSLPPNVIFNNKGNVYLDTLETLPSGVKFKNSGVGDVYLQSLKTLPPDVEFRNSGSIYLDSLKTLPSEAEFNNGRSISSVRLKTIPPGVNFNNGGSVFLVSLTGGFFLEWEGNIDEIDPNRLLNAMINKGLFER